MIRNRSSGPFTGDWLAADALSLNAFAKNVSEREKGIERIAMSQIGPKCLKRIQVL
jgi:hypothetical protein